MRISETVKRGSKMANLKPEKVWRVGDATYDNYEDARKAATNHAQEDLRVELAQTIDGVLNGASAMKVTGYQIAGRVLGHYHVRRNPAK
jgi:hypothetical protein